MDEKLNVMPEKDREITIERYSRRFREFGDDPRTLGWDKGKQDLRYSVLLGEFDLNGKSILDIGCGFGDANRVISTITDNYSYTGIDIVKDLIDCANEKHKANKRISFIHGDFLEHSFDQNFDIVIASGVFNFKLQHGDNYRFIHAMMSKAFKTANEGAAFDFLSSHVDHRYEITFHSDPAIILQNAYSFTRNVILRNNYMPFEFSAHLFKDDTFDVTNTVFHRFMRENPLLFP